jgi:hypothetical protein
MSSNKEKLIKLVEKMSDDDVQRLSDILDVLESEGSESVTWKKLMADPHFNVPMKTGSKFRKSKPAKGKGTLPAELIIKDRK